jgi:hypothetical protein
LAIWKYARADGEVAGLSWLHVGDEATAGLASDVAAITPAVRNRAKADLLIGELLRERSTSRAGHGRADGKSSKAINAS